MNILFIADIVPYPPNTGIKIRTYNIIKQLAKEHNIYLFAFNHKIMIDSAEKMKLCTDELSKYCRQVEVFEIPSDRNKATYLYCLGLNLFQLSPYRVKRYYSKKCFKKISETLNEVKIHLVHLDKTELYGGYKKLFIGIPIVATNHNVESHLMKQRARLEINFARRFFAYLQYLKTQKYEKKILSRIEGYITCTGVDRAFFRDKLGIQTRCEVIENGVDVEYYSPKGLTEGNYFLIIGAQNKVSTANYDATIFFMREIWPKISIRNKDIKLRIVGRNPDKAIIDFEQEFTGVEVTGFVWDEREVIEKCTALLVPLRVGGGSRLKILTAMAMGKVVISTKIGAEGIQCEHGKNIIIEDNPVEFAEKVLRIYEDRKVRLTIGKRARKLAFAQYDWNTIGNKLLKFYSEIIQNE